MQGSRLQTRSKLLLGCGGAALAIGLALAPDRAHAQAFQATETIVSGSATRINTGTGTETIEIDSATAVIDWIPDEDGAGNALDFLPTSNVATFQNGTSVTDFAVLNRILPATNGNITVFDGTVISQLVAAGGGPIGPGGTVVFYSPTGILVGANAVFDVGNLVLTTLDPDLASFDDFAINGGPLIMGGSPTTAVIQIDPGALIQATEENSFFAVTAAEIQMLGASNVNGSTAFVAGEAVNITVSNGLFDIQIPVGTSAVNPLVLDGTIGGPSSTGVTGDNHLIYAVARAQTNPISLLFSGNLGFDTAASAGIVNGEIILSANYEVSGRDVDGGSVDGGIFQDFDANSQLTPGDGSISIDNLTATSSILAIGNGDVAAAANGATTFVDGNLLLVGRSTADLFAGLGGIIDITGDVLVSANSYGLVSPIPSTGEIDAFSGDALIEAFDGGSITIGGNTVVRADAIAGADTSIQQSGAATAGFAGITATNGSVAILGGAAITASARATGTVTDFLIGNTFVGGTSRFLAIQGGDITVDGNASVTSDADGAVGSLLAPSTASDAIAGTASAVTVNAGSTLTFNQQLIATASANAGASNDATQGGVGDGGDVLVSVDSSGTITVGQDVFLLANGQGGINNGGLGGDGLGGGASIGITDQAGVINIGGDFTAEADGIGGDGIDGGEGRGGLSGAIIDLGAFTVDGDAVAQALGVGGDAGLGFGGDGGDGRGGFSFIQATGSLTEVASITIGGTAIVNTDGEGGDGGAGDGSVINAGIGGDGFGGDFTTPNFVNAGLFNGAVILAGADNGNISVTGTSFLSSRGTGGAGGVGGTGQVGGTGGVGVGGDGSIGLNNIIGGSIPNSGDGSVGAGTADFGDIFVDGSGIGGFGGGAGTLQGDGRRGIGGAAFLISTAGATTAGNVNLVADGIGGDGANGGDGLVNDDAGALTTLGGSLTISSITARARGVGGQGTAGVGGNGTGGDAFVLFQDGTVQINGNATVDASGIGGNSTDGDGANGTGGLAALTIFNPIAGTGVVTGNAVAIANGTGGEASSGNTGGVGTGGVARTRSQAGGSVTFGSLQLITVGRGGSGPDSAGGAGIGGTAEILADGAGSTLTIQNDVPFGQGFVGTDSFSDLGFAGVILEPLVAVSGLGGNATGGTGIGGTGQGGDISIIATGDSSISLPSVGTGTFSGVLLVSRGRGGNVNVEGGVGGLGFGGDTTVRADGSTIDLGDTLFHNEGPGGRSLNDALNITGGDATHGDKLVEAINGATIRGTFSSFGAFGSSGSGTGNGGNGTGGTAILRVIDSTLDLTGPNVFGAGQGGGAGNIGGDGDGGTTQFFASNSVISISPDANGQGILILGEQASGSPGAIQGGDAFAGNVAIQILDSTIDAPSLPSAFFFDGTLGVISNAFGGSASEAGGVGGTATTGLVSIDFSESTIDLAGNFTVQQQAIGGEALLGTGGDAIGGGINFVSTGSSTSFSLGPSGTAGLLFDSAATGGEGANQGGSASSGDISALISDSDLTGGSLTITSNATGGAATDGDNDLGLGAGNGGIIEVSVEDSLLNLIGQSTISADGTGGDAGAGTGGEGQGGRAVVNLVNSDLNIIGGPAAPGGLTLSADGIGGSGTVKMGDGDGQVVELSITDANIDGGSILLRANGTAIATSTGVDGGDVSAGELRFAVNGASSVELDSLRLEGIGATSAGDDADGGFAQLILGTSQGPIVPQVNIGDLSIAVDATGGFDSGPANEAGEFAVRALSGQLTVQNFTGSALGDDLNGELGASALEAVGGDILVSGNLVVDVFNDFNITTGLGNIIGGPDPLAPTATILITSQALLSIFGDDDNQISFGGASMSLTSRDIVIENGARIGAFDVSLTSNNLENPALIGGTSGPVNGDPNFGYVLSGVEAERIEVGNFSFAQPELTSGGVNDPDIVVRDVFAAGSLDDGVSSIQVGVGGTGGIIRVEGQVVLEDAALTDTVSFFANERIEVVTPGGIGIVDPDGDPTGDLILSANNIWIADSDTIEDLQADPNFTGRNAQLATAAAGSDEPLGYIRAAGVSLNVGQSLLVRNTGTISAPGGILVGSQGLSIFSGEGGSSSSSGIDVYAFGAGLGEAGQLITGESFFQQVEFNETGTNATTYADDAQFNNCVITSSVCSAGEGGSEVEEVAATVNNPSVVEAAVTSAQPVVVSEAESDEEFGIDFPGLVESEDLEEDGDIDDPVASGGDSSLYGQGNAGSVRVEGN